MKFGYGGFFYTIFFNRDKVQKYWVPSYGPFYSLRMFRMRGLCPTAPSLFKNMTLTAILIFKFFILRSDKQNKQI